MQQGLERRAQHLTGGHGEAIGHGPHRVVQRRRQDRRDGGGRVLGLQAAYPVGRQFQRDDVGEVVPPGRTGHAPPLLRPGALPGYEHLEGAGVGRQWLGAVQAGPVRPAQPVDEQRQTRVIHHCPVSGEQENMVVDVDAE